MSGAIEQPTFLEHALKVAGLSFVAWLVWNTSDAVLGRVFNGTNKPRSRR